MPFSFFIPLSILYLSYFNIQLFFSSLFLMIYTLLDLSFCLCSFVMFVSLSPISHVSLSLTYLFSLSHLSLSLPLFLISGSPFFSHHSFFSYSDPSLICLCLLCLSLIYLCLSLSSLISLFLSILTVYLTLPSPCLLLFTRSLLMFRTSLSISFSHLFKFTSLSHFPSVSYLSLAVSLIVCLSVNLFILFSHLSVCPLCVLYTDDFLNIVKLTNSAGLKVDRGGACP